MTTKGKLGNEKIFNTDVGAVVDGGGFRYRQCRPS
jgi:hypothetical protein